MTRYCAGDAQAFRELYRLVAPCLLSRLSDLTGDRARAETLLCDAFGKIHRWRDRYVEGADPLPWFELVACGGKRARRALAIG